MCRSMTALSDEVLAFCESRRVKIHPVRHDQFSLDGYVFVLPVRGFSRLNLELSGILRETEYTVQIHMQPVFSKKGREKIVIFITDDLDWAEGRFYLPAGWRFRDPGLNKPKTPEQRYHELITRRTFLQRYPFVYTDPDRHARLTETISKNNENFEQLYRELWEEWHQDWQYFKKNNMKYLKLAPLLDFI